MDVERFKRLQIETSATTNGSRRRPFAVVPSEFVVSARVQVQRVMPVWMAKARWLVLRGSKTPILAVYRQVSTFVMHQNPLRVMLLGADTAVHAVGEKCLVIVSSRVRRNDTWSMAFESSGQRKRMYELVKLWIQLSAFLQTLKGFESIARSEYSAVYRCHDKGDSRCVYALKRVNRAKCWNEIEVLEKIVNIEAIQPHVPRHFFMFEDNKDNSVSIATKFYNGGSLEDRIRFLGPLSESVVRAVIVPLCVALHLLHQNDILHLDVKPANILFDTDTSTEFENLKLIDFGSSTIASTVCGKQLMIPGTYGCMAPERFDGRCGPEADVFGVGIVVYHMVTGEIPFVGIDNVQVMARNMAGVVSFSHPRWRQTSKHLRVVCNRMLEKDPDKRITLAEIIKLPWLVRTKSNQGLSAQPPASL